MTIHRVFCFLYYLLAVLAQAVDADAAPFPDALLLENVNVVDAENDRVVTDQNVLIVDGRIALIAPAAKMPSSVTAARRDLHGGYLTPALYDLHVHIFDQRDLRLYALMGIQTVRNMDGWDWHLGLRDRHDATDDWTAKLHTSGRQYQAPLVGTPQDIRVAFGEDVDAGYDWIKLYDNIDHALFQAIPDTPHGDMKITGHLPDDIALSEVLDSCVYDDIAHAEELLQAMKAESAEWRASIDEVAEKMKACPTALTTTLITNRMIAEQAADFAANISRDEVAYAPPLLQMFWRSDFNPNRNLDQQAASRIAKNYADMKELVAALAARGVVILAGTDAPNPTTVPAFSLYEELEILTEAGLSSARAIRAATLDVARELGQGDTAGKIVEGASADFIVTRANPLDNVTTLRSFDALVRDGVYRSRDEIDGELESLRDQYASDLVYMNLFSPEGPDAILDAIRNHGESAPITEAGLQSLEWIYMKFGNIDAAASIQNELQAQFHARPDHAPAGQ